jgi:CRISPR-associated protein Cpf1
MLYTRANYTSITDPLTGWRKSIYLQRGSVEKVKRAILEGFDDIGFQNGHYFFEYTHKKTGRKIRLWSGHNGEELLRYRGRRNAKHIWTIERVKIEEILDKLFSEFDKTISLKEQLLDGLPLQRADEGYTAWESLRFVIDLIQQIRNSGDVSRGEDDNFLLSPVRNDKGEYFDSRRYRDQNNSEFPKDADANGAYNIARKGILMAAHIKEWVNNGMPKKGNVSDLDLFISDAEWDLWLHDKKDWNKQLEWFSSNELKKNK